MTSYEFEKAAKNAVIKVLNENINISELDLVIGAVFVLWAICKLQDKD